MREPPVKRPKRSFRPPRMLVKSNTPTRAAASSMASGMPSRRLVMSAIVTRASSFRRTLGLAERARSTKSPTATLPLRSMAPAAWSGYSQAWYPPDRLSTHPEGVAAGHQHPQPWARRRAVPPLAAPPCSRRARNRRSRPRLTTALLLGDYFNERPLGLGHYS